MFTQHDVNILKNQLPTSAVMEIFKRTKISRPTIYRFLNCEKVRYSLQLKIYSAALKIIERDKIRTGKIKQERARILNSDFDGE
jgi:DNA-binding IclR family transcriptional regulator